jgi:glycosyltransferase involved in cell wall biosynthesis
MLPRIPTSPPVIPSVVTDGKRPLWSVMIPVYNCSSYLVETLETVLIQNIPEEDMQIEVIDDSSTDADVEALVKKNGKGRVKYFRQLQNVGSLRNFETCISRAEGHLIHLLHGDDRIKKGYYEQIHSLFKTYPEIGAAFCRFDYINNAGEKIYEQPEEIKEEGILKDWLLRIAERNLIQYCSITVKREVYES